MKIRADFVTNSSSSGFIVAFPEKITSLEYVKRYIEVYKAKTVYRDSKKQKPLIAKSKAAKEKVIDELRTGYFPGAPDWGKEFDKFKEKYAFTDRERWRYITQFEDSYNKLFDEAMTPIAEDFLNQIPNHYLYFFEYGDEDGEFGSQMEHGDTFSKLHFLRISHH